MTKVVHLYASQRVSRRAKDGSDGTSVTIISKSVTYQISASGTETPTGNWSDKVVATTDTKPYLWTRTIVVYSDTNSTTSYSVSYKGKDGAAGKDAVNINLSPSELVYNADKDGYISSTQFNDNSCKVSATRGGKAVSCSASIEEKDNCEANISSSNVIKLTKITIEFVGTGKYVPASAGGVKLKVTVDGTDYYSYLPFRVNTNTFVKTVLETDETFQRKYTEISNQYNTVSNELNGKVSKDELREVSSSIEQTAREISLSVSEKTIGRRNLLIGSAFQRDDNNRIIHYAASIEINSGYQGTNCIKVIDNTKKGDPHYIGAFWDGSQGGKSVKITKGKKYVLSCYCKTNDINGIFCLEALYTDKQTNAQRVGNPKYLTNSSFRCERANQWELFTAVIDTTDAEYDYIAFNFFEYSNGDYGRIEAWICRPMVEEGDTYNGWTLSTEDYDYVGGNMLDNTRTLDKSGTLYDVNGALTPAGFGESTSIYKSFVYKLKGTVDSFSQLPSSGNVYGDTYCVRNTEICYRYNGSEFESVGNDYYYNVLEWRKLESGAFVPFGLEANKDYVFSFMAKGTGKLTAYFYSPETNVFIESSLGETATRVDGAANFQLTSDWKKYWVHWRPSDSSHRYILLRLNRTIQSSAGDAPITNCYIAQPKLEAGAVVTEYTERKSDLVDKASLKAAGIEITSDQVKLYGDKVQVLTRKEGSTEYEEAGMFSNGKLNANLIDAGEVVANGINAKEVTATKLHVTGDSTFGIWTVDGNQITTKGSFEFNGMTFIGQSIQYTAGFVRAGSINAKYMRLGSETAEFGEFRNNAYNGIWFGSASNTVYNGNSNYWKLPTDYKYKEVESATVSGTPTAYIHNTDSGENPAFAINRPNGGVALRTNGALKGSHAFNTRRTNSTLINMQNGEGLIVCTSNYATTVNLPKNPAIGEMVTIIQSGNGKLSIYGSNNIKTISKDDNESDGRISATKGQINLFFYDGTHWVCSFINNYLNKI